MTIWLPGLLLLIAEFRVAASVRASAQVAVTVFASARETDHGPTSRMPAASALITTAITHAHDAGRLNALTSSSPTRWCSWRAAAPYLPGRVRENISQQYASRHGSLAALPNAGSLPGNKLFGAGQQNRANIRAAC